MKKTFIAASVVASVFAVSAFADDGKINFVGAITDTACTVVNTVANPLTVTMGTVSTKAFTGAGSTAAPSRFTLELTDCPAEAKTAAVKFDGTPDATANSVLALTEETGVAKGVGIQIYDKDNNPVPLHTASGSYALKVGANSLDFVARYYATAASVTAGPANSTSNFTIIYN